MEPHADSVAALALRYAREKLGPQSVVVLGQPAAMARVEAGVAAGARIEDEVLKELFQAAKTHRGVANEFFSHFLFGVIGIARDTLAPQLRRLVDTGDLLDSVMGSLWEDLRELHFETRAQFVRLVAQALRWKAQEYDRRMRTLRRREDMHAQASPEELQLAGEDPTPSAVVRSEEERGLLLEVLARLPNKQRYLLRRHLNGDSIADIALDLGTTEATARKALERALQKAKDLGFR